VKHEMLKAVPMSEELMEPKALKKLFDA